MKTIPLACGKIAIVDDRDYEELSRFAWFAVEDRYTFYAVRHVRRNGKRTSERMHRRIMKAKKGELVDHENRNGLDCQRQNLRICTHSQNGANRTKGKNCLSKFKGVTWNRTANKWQSQIQANGKSYYLGLFIDDEEAARVYDTAAKNLFGTFASPNFKG